jgi:predicted AAA+ superfamily ATPase
MENFVMSELARQLTWPETAAALYHYHDSDGHEVDAILEGMHLSIVDNRGPKGKDRQPIEHSRLRP